MRATTLIVAIICSLSIPAHANDSQTRSVNDQAALRTWLENMVWHHRFSVPEVSQVTGLSIEDVKSKLAEFNITEATRPQRPVKKLFVLPYPGGRHPRIGFLDGAIDPQRETKLSVFCPWDNHSYAVLDVPEAIWSNLGLTYLAHTHVPTIWSKQGIDLPQLEWDHDAQGNFSLVRTLPNGIEFGVKVIPMVDHLRMKMWITNGTDAPLTDLRVQNCVMLKAVEGFTQQNNDNKRYDKGYAVARSTTAENSVSRWIISGWDPLHRAWGNEKCPCLHSDPKFPDCAPGETTWIRGWFSFYEGREIDQELDRIEATGWRTHPLHHVTGNLVGKVVDSGTGKTLPCRLYVQNLKDQQWHFATSTAVAGSAIRYAKQRGVASIERHTTLSADGFQLNLPPGRYRISAHHGKEFMPSVKEVNVGKERQRIRLTLTRFVNMSNKGWYSGDTHVHRTMEELPNVILAEDLNVALPLNYWVTRDGVLPSTSGPILEPIVHAVDPTHVIYPINTEYEIFQIGERRHTQGAVFVLNHRTPLQLSTPPTLRVAQESRQQGAILDLDKHSWNWSLMIVPVMGVDLFELSNNHHWRTKFGFPKWTYENVPDDWPELETDANGFTERGWTDFGFQTYYGLLSCGFRMRVSAGTASGVHPVPLGHGRVYVHTGDEFSYEEWIEGLNDGHSFVTQGPLLDVRFNEELPGTTWKKKAHKNTIKVTGTIDSIRPLEVIEIISNGKVVHQSIPQTIRAKNGSYRTRLDHSVDLKGSGWLAVRCFEQMPRGKVCFAHSNPVFVDVEGVPLRPNRQVVEYFIHRMEEEIRRNTGILSDKALSEFHRAKEIYQQLLSE